MAVSARDSKLLEQIQNLLAQVDYLTKKLFGTSSEKMKDVQLEALPPWCKEVQNVCKN